MPNDDVIGASFSIDVTNLKAGLYQANRLIRESESEFRAAAAGMDDWSKSQEGLQKRAQTLSTQIDLQTKKVDALIKSKEEIIQKMTAEGKSQEEISAAIDGTNKQIASESKQLDKLKGELNKTNSALNKMQAESQQTQTASQKLRSEIEKQEKSLADLKEEHLNSVLAHGKHSKAARELQSKINSLNSDLEKNKNKLDDAAGASKKAAGGFEGLKGAGAGVAGVLGGIAAACVGAITGFLGLAESTREYREDQAKLQTAFETNGFTAETATKAYQDMFAVIGESDRSVEAVNHLAKLTDSEEELAKWSDITAGVVGTFGDSLPIEGLTEAANETAKVSKVTGPLADAINWATTENKDWDAALSSNKDALAAFQQATAEGATAEDAFNAALAACNSEQERASLITNALNSIYGDAAAKYKEVNKDVMDAQRAQAGLTDATAKLGAIAEPIMTTLKILATDLLTAITPFVSLIGDGLTKALSGADGAAESLANGLSGIVSVLVEKVTTILPAVAEVFSQLVPTLVTALVNQLPLVLTTLLDIITQVINTLAATLPTIITAVVAIIPQLVIALVSAVPQLLQAAVTLLMAIVQALPTIINALVTALPTVVQTIVDVLIQSIPILIDGAIQLLMAIVDAIPQIIPPIIAALPQIINTIVNGLITALPQVLNGAIQLLMAIIKAIPTIVSALSGALPQIITAIVGTLASNFPQILKAGIDLLIGIVKAIPQIITELAANLPQIIDAIVNGLSDGISAIADVGKDLIRGLWEGISDMAGWIADKISGFGESVLGSLKSFFGIASPSKVMADVIGKNLALGIGTGFEKSIGGVNKEIQNAMQFDDASVNVNATRGNGAAGGVAGGVTVYQTNNYSQAHSRYELFKSKEQTAAAVRLAMQGG